MTSVTKAEPQQLAEARAFAARLAWKAHAGLTERERELVLIEMIEALPESEAQIADRVLFSLRESATAQMELNLAVEAGLQAPGKPAA